MGTCHRAPAAPAFTRPSSPSQFHSCATGHRMSHRPIALLPNLPSGLGLEVWAAWFRSLLPGHVALRLVVGGGWRLAVGGGPWGLSLRADLNKKRGGGGLVERWQLGRLPPTQRAVSHERETGRAVLNGKKKLFRYMVFSKTTACSSYVQPWLAAIGGWRLVEIAGWRLVVGSGWRQLAAVGSW